MTAAMTTDGSGGVYDTTSSSFVDACKASWFSASIGSLNKTLPIIMSSSQFTGTVTGTVTVTMPADALNNQAACGSLTPQVAVTAS